MYSSVSHVRELAVTPRSRPPQRPGTTLGGMRILAGLCSLVLLLAPAARPVFADEVVVDDAAPTVQISGEWATSTVSGGFIGSGYRYRVAGDGSSSVTWLLPASASAATYEVFARWTSGPNRASNATYVVTHAAGTASITVDQRSKGGDWQSLGTFSFSPGASQGVRLSDKADGVVVADAVRWVPSSGTSPASVASPASGATPSSAASPSATAASRDPRFFEQTRFRVDRDAFWDFFQKRGGVRTFGYPVSREFTFFGCQTQLFQRLAMQQCGDQGVGTLNVLEDGLLPYNHFQGTTVPLPDPALIAAAPPASDPEFATKAIDFVRANAPDSFEGEPVKFFATFQI